MSYPPAYPHDPIEEIGEDLFMARGSIRINALGRITRNMAIVRHAGELTLINPIRLSAAGEEQLKALGDVERIMRLGPMHGLDDPYYVDKGAEFWCQAGGTTYTVPEIYQEMSAGSALPFPDARLFCFVSTKQPESALLIQRAGSGILLTCDAIQHYGDYGRTSLIPRLLMPFIGFPKTTLVGPIWLKLMTPDGGSLRGEFERLLTLEFDGLLSAHGSFLREGAHEAVERAVARAFDS